MIDSACIFYGDTPTCMFTSWRLSYTDIAVIHISDKLSGDGMISWKSNKLGSNFYTPNVFINDMDSEGKNSSSTDLNEKLKNFLINYLFISCNSIFELKRVCKKLANVINESTIVFVESNFAVNLDFLVYEQLKLERGKGSEVAVFGVLSDLEGRKLTSGSFTLLSNDIDYYFGLTYIQSIKELSNDFLNYLKKIGGQLNDKDSKLNIFFDSLNSSGENMIKFHKMSIYGNELAIRVWEHVIPKMAFNIISIIYEDTEYDHFIGKNQSMARELSLNILKELTIIAYYHCNCDFELINPNNKNKNFVNQLTFLPYIKSSKDIANIESLLDYEKCLSLILKKKKFLNSETHIENSPEFVSLSFEAYSFYHKLEFPASILLTQPAELSKKYNLQSVCLKFLSQFYERLCILSGMPVYLTNSTKIIDGLSDLNQKKQSLIFSKGNVLLTGSLNNINSNSKKKINNNESYEKSKQKKKQDKKDRLERRRKKEKIKKNNTKKPIDQQRQTKETKNKTETKVDSSFQNDAEDQIADDIAALYLDALDNVNDIHDINSSKIASNPIVEENEEGEARNGKTSSTASNTESDYTFKTAESEVSGNSETNYDSESTTESDYSLNSYSTSGSSITSYKNGNSKNRTRKNSLQHKKYRRNKKSTNDPSINLPKKSTYNPYNAFNTKINSKIKSIKKKKQDSNIQLYSYDEDVILNKPNYGHNNSFISLSRLMNINTEKDVLHRLSHEFELEDMSRYYGLYGDHPAIVELKNKQKHENEKLKLKRQQLMNDISRFRRFKIDNSMKFGYGNSSQYNEKHNGNLDNNLSFYKYIDVISAPINVDLSGNSTNRFGKNDSIRSLIETKQKKKHNIDKKESNESKQKMIEYKLKEDGNK